MDWRDWAVFGLGVGIAHPATRSYTIHVTRDLSVLGLRFGWGVGKSLVTHAPKLGPVARNLGWFAVAFEVTNFAHHVSGGGRLSDYDPVVAGSQADWLFGLGDTSFEEVQSQTGKDLRDLTYWAHRQIGLVI